MRSWKAVSASDRVLNWINESLNWKGSTMNLKRRVTRLEATTNELPKAAAPAPPKQVRRLIDLLADFPTELLSKWLNDDNGIASARSICSQVAVQARSSKLTTYEEILHDLPEEVLLALRELCEQEFFDKSC